MNADIQFLLPDASPGGGPYRIVYLLHGLHGNQGSWLDNSMLPFYAKKYNAIFAMPDAGRSFYTDQKYGRKYFSYISEELPGVCRKFFNISPRREDTAVIGYSMGGYGAFRLALAKPEQIGFCGAIAPACLYFKPILDGLRTDSQSYLKTGPEAAEIFADFSCIYGDGLEYRPDYDVSVLIKNFPAGTPRPKIYMCCGTGDNLRKENLLFREQMTNTGFDYTYEEWAGDHDWNFFNTALQKTLSFWYGE
jgi:S-formylglutathione hydrolase FrmB